MTNFSFQAYQIIFHKLYKVFHLPEIFFSLFLNPYLSIKTQLSFYVLDLFCKVIRTSFLGKEKCQKFSKLIRKSCWIVRVHFNYEMALRCFIITERFTVSHSSLSHSGGVSDPRVSVRR